MIGILGRANGSGEGWGGGAKVEPMFGQVGSIVGGALSQRSPSLRVGVGLWICFQEKMETPTRPLLRPLPPPTILTVVGYDTQ